MGLFYKSKTLVFSELGWVTPLVHSSVISFVATNARIKVNTDQRESDFGLFPNGS